MQAQFTGSVMEALNRLRGQPITQTQILNILQVHNVAPTEHNQQLALEYLQNSTASSSSSAGPAAPAPLQLRAPLQDMAVGGMTQEQVKESAAPLIHLDPMGQPIGHNIVDPGFAEVQMAAEPPKVIPARERKRMPMKYHRKWGKLATAVMQGTLSYDKARETLKDLRLQRHMAEEQKRQRKNKREAAQTVEPVGITRKVKKNIAKTTVPKDESDSDEEVKKP
jgi:hypothetical protein